MRAIADQVAAAAASSVPGCDVLDAWAGGYEAVAQGARFRTLRQCALRSLAAVMADVGCAGDPADLCAAQFRYRQAPPSRPGTREFLSWITLPVCVVSDVDRADLNAAMTHHRLSFSAVVTSEDVGAYKPHPTMCARALETLDLGADEVLHVGDSITADVHGAHEAGIRAVWINHRGHTPPHDTSAAYEVDDLTGVMKIVDALIDPGDAPQVR